jgi:DnaK suppressor protein
MDVRTAQRRLEEERDRLRRLVEQGSDRLQRDIEAQASELSTFDQHPGDVATDMHDREIGQSVLEDLESQLDDVEAALDRVGRGTYGQCEFGGHPIPPERLEARPTARYCLEHQLEAETDRGA